MKLNQEELFSALGLLIDRIESCGASTPLTNAVILASDIKLTVGNQWNPADDYAAERVRELLLAKNTP